MRMQNFKQAINTLSQGIVGIFESMIKILVGILGIIKNKYVIMIILLIFLRKGYILVEDYFEYKSPKNDCEKLYGKYYNKERQKRGIPIIADYLFYKGNNVCINDTLYYRQKNIKMQWVNKNEPAGRHGIKIVKVLDNQIFSETDIYYGNKKGKLYYKENEGYEVILITYSYKNEKEKTNPWFINADVHNLKNYPTSLWKADSILKSWGIARINYIIDENNKTWIKYLKKERTIPKKTIEPRPEEWIDPFEDDFFYWLD